MLSSSWLRPPITARHRREPTMYEPFDETSRLAVDLARSVHQGRFGPSVVGVVDDAPPIVVPLGESHPLEWLLGFDAPSWWRAVAVVARGTVVARSGLSGAAGPAAGAAVVAATVIARDGGESSTVLDGEGRDAVGAAGAEGLVPDAARRSLGRPTPDPEGSVIGWWATEWLAEVARLVRSHPGCWTWHDVAAVHPALAEDELPERTVDLVDLVIERGRDHARLTGWEGVRASLAAGLLADPVCPAGLAGWFDAGSFSRFADAARPSPLQLRSMLAAQLSAASLAALDRVLWAWGRSGVVG
jgi:hypothetical protein